MTGVAVFKTINGTTYDANTKTRHSEVITISELDGNNSQIWAGSTFHQFTNESGAIKEITRSKDTDDKIVIGYIKGLPFFIAVDSFYGGESQLTFQFIDEHVVPLMAQYVENLSQGNQEPDAIIKRMIKDIHQQRFLNAKDAEFTMSLMVTFKKDNELYSVGFGVGDTGIVIRRKNGDVEQLVYNVRVYESDDDKNYTKDAFDNYCANAQVLISRASIFNIRVNPGDVFFAYTSLPGGMEKSSSDFIEVDNMKAKITTKQRIQRFAFDASTLTTEGMPENSSFFEKIKNAIILFEGREVENAKSIASGSSDVRIGDDCAIGSVIIPSAKLQHTLELATSETLFSDIRMIVYQYMAWMNANAPVTTLIQRMSLFLPLENDVQRATTLLKCVNQGGLYSHLEILKITLEVYNKSGAEPYSLGRYLHPLLFDSAQVIDVGSESEFLAKKQEALNPEESAGYTPG